MYLYSYSIIMWFCGMDHHYAQTEVKVWRSKSKYVRHQSDCLRVNDRDKCRDVVCTLLHSMYVHTTDSHGGIKVCDSSHEAISYPALCCPFNASCSKPSGEYERRDEGDVHGRRTLDKRRGLSGLCLEYACKRVFGWLGLLVRLVSLSQWELRHSTGGG